LTTKHAPLASSNVQGGGKRRSAIRSNLLLRADARQARPGS
jgi:hypothetical protein